jgi:chromosome segregation ATPase
MAGLPHGTSLRWGDSARWRLRNRRQRASASPPDERPLTEAEAAIEAQLARLRTLRARRLALDAAQTACTNALTEMRRERAKLLDWISDIERRMSVGRIDLAHREGEERELHKRRRNLRRHDDSAEAIAEEKERISAELRPLIAVVNRCEAWLESEHRVARHEIR